MTTLIDANVLIALTVTEHEHHDRAARWVSTTGRLAVCPIVEGALVRFLVRIGESADAAAAIASAVRSRCVFWPADLSYADVSMAHVRGHRQVTDAYLAALAVHHGGRLATLDEGLAAERPEATVLVP